MVTNGHLPFGYKADANLHYAIDEPEAEIVREIFTRVSNGAKLVDIASDLNRRGIKTSRGREWGRSSFHSILGNERYRGIYIYGDYRKEGGIPRIVSDELFYKVQEVSKVKKEVKGRHQPNGDYLLTGKLFCGKCDSHMIGMSGTGKSGALHFYYACSKKRSGGKCDKKQIRRDYIEAEIARNIMDYILRDDIITWIADSVDQYQRQHKDNPELVLLQTQLEETKRSINNVLTAIEQGIITPSTKERLHELESQQSIISGKIAVINADHIEVSRSDVIAWLRSFSGGDVNDKAFQASLFDSFLVAVYLYDDDRMKILFDAGTGAEKSIVADLVKEDFDSDSRKNARKNECSLNLPSAPPNKLKANPFPLGDGFAFIVYF